MQQLLRLETLQIPVAAWETAMEYLENADRSLFPTSAAAGEGVKGRRLCSHHWKSTQSRD